MRQNPGLAVFALLALALQFAFGFGQVHVHDHWQQTATRDAVATSRHDTLSDHDRNVKREKQHNGHAYGHNAGAPGDHNGPEHGSSEHNDNPDDQHDEYSCLTCRVLAGLQSLLPHSIAFNSPAYTVTSQKFFIASDEYVPAIAGRIYQARAPPFFVSLIQ